MISKKCINLSIKRSNSCSGITVTVAGPLEGFWCWEQVRPSRSSTVCYNLAENTARLMTVLHHWKVCFYSWLSIMSAIFLGKCWIAKVFKRNWGKWKNKSLRNCFATSFLLGCFPPEQGCYVSVINDLFTASLVYNTAKMWFFFWVVFLLSAVPFMCRHNRAFRIDLHMWFGIISYVGCSFWQPCAFTPSGRRHCRHSATKPVLFIWMLHSAAQ